MSEIRLPSRLRATLNALARWVNSGNIPHALIGGIAVSLLAEPRTTKDIDLVIWLEQIPDEGFLHKAAKFGFISRIANPIAFAQKARILLLQHRTTGVNVDVSLGALPFEKEMIDHATPGALGDSGLRVATAEDLIITKSVPLRPQDLADIDSLLEVNPAVNYRRIRRWATEFQRLLDQPENIVKLEEVLNRHQRK